MAMRDMQDVRHLPACRMSMITIVLVVATVTIVTPAVNAAGPTDRSPETSRPAEQSETSRYGHSRYDSDEADVPTVYVVPMNGQMGTDIHTEIYKEVVKDILLHTPDLIVFILDSSEYPDLMIPEVEDPRETRGLWAIDEYRDLVSMLKSDLADYRQVLWIKDSVGFSSMLALAWSELYMSPETRFWGLRSVIDRSGADKWSDPDIRAKMSAAWSASVKSFLEYGDQDMQLADAMLWPEKLLSASYRGREVVWSLNDLGEFVIDNDDEKTLALRAKAAEDLLISDGTVESLDDLTFLLGYREYRELDGAVKIVEDYIDNWRATYGKTEELWADYHQHRGWATGRDTRKYLSLAKRNLEQIMRAMTRYKAVETRWLTDQGVSRLDLEIEVEKMRETLRALRRTRGGGGGGGGGGGFGSGGGRG